MMNLTMLKALDCAEESSKLLTYQDWMTNDRLQMITVIIYVNLMYCDVYF